MKTTVKERLIQFLKYKNLSQGKFERACGVSNGYVNMVKNNISVQKLNQIKTAFPELNELWLMTGEGSMVAGEEIESIINQNNETLPLNVYEGEVLQCGFPMGESGAITKNLMTNTIVIPDAPKDVMYIRAFGDSMTCTDYRSIPSGAYVAIRKKQTRSIQWGEVYALATRDGFIIKRLMPGDSADTITCESFNPKFPPFQLYLTDIIDVAIVVGVITAVFR